MAKLDLPELTEEDWDNAVVIVVPKHLSPAEKQESRARQLKAILSKAEAKHTRPSSATKTRPPK